MTDPTHDSAGVRDSPTHSSPSRTHITTKRRALSEYGYSDSGSEMEHGSPPLRFAADSATAHFAPLPNAALGAQVRGSSYASRGAVTDAASLPSGGLGDVLGRIHGVAGESHNPVLAAMPPRHPAHGAGVATTVRDGDKADASAYAASAPSACDGGAGARAPQVAARTLLLPLPAGYLPGLAAVSVLEDVEAAVRPAEVEEGNVEYKRHLMVAGAGAHSTQTLTPASAGAVASSPRAGGGGAAAASAPPFGASLLLPASPATLKTASPLADGGAVVGTPGPRPAPAPAGGGSSGGLSRLDRLRQLVTQLRWRLREGGGSAVYYVGMDDSGLPVGLPLADLNASLATLMDIAAQADAHVQAVVLRRTRTVLAAQPGGGLGLTPPAPAQASTAPLRYVAEARLFSKTHGGARRPELRVVLLGPHNSGKSTWLGGVACGIQDNGRGLARLHVFRHRHEVESGQTSCASHHVIGFDAAGVLVHHSSRGLGLSLADAGAAAPEAGACGSQSSAGAGASPSASSGAAPRDAADVLSRGLSPEDIAQASARLITLVETAGDPRFVRTTLSGMSATRPDYLQMFVSVDAVAGSQSIPASGVDASGDNDEPSPPRGLDRLTRTYLDFVVSTAIPFFVVLTKVDTVPEAVAAHAASVIKAFLSARLSREASALLLPRMRATLVAPADHKREAVIVRDFDAATAIARGGLANVVPIVAVSNVTGAGLPQLLALLRHLPPRHDWDCAALEQPDFHIEDTFTLGGHTIAAGLCARGTIAVGTPLCLGPDFLGNARDVLVASLHVRRKPVSTISAGDFATLSLQCPDGAPLPPQFVRRGQSVTSSQGDTESVCGAAIGFTAEVLFSPSFWGSTHTHVRAGRHLVAYSDGVRQAVRVMEASAASPSVVAPCRLILRFLHEPEHLHVGAQLLLRDGNSVASGKILAVTADRANAVLSSRVVKQRTRAAPKYDKAPAAAPHESDGSSDEDGIFGALDHMDVHM
jgi:GTPase